jgi:hypothetical protein
MEATLKIADLHEAYRSATAAEAIAMANLGAICWSAFKDGLYDHWNTELAADEATKAVKYRDQGRTEGRHQMLDSLKARLAEVDTLESELSIARTSIEQLQTAVAKEASRQAEAIVDSVRTEMEIAHVKEMAALQAQVATIEVKQKLLEHMEARNEELRGQNVELAERCKALTEELAEKTPTKSSHAIGKKGESEVYDMLLNGVCQVFQYSSVCNMSGVTHSADFHLTIRGEDGAPIKILIDSKKYARPVGSSEIKKLHSDIDADDDARAGMMISLNSPIQTARMFMIKYTDKGRPVLYLTLEDVEAERQKDVLCWAVYVLQSIAGKRDIDDRLHMIEELDLFLGGLDKSVKEIDMVIRQQNKAISAMRDMKAALIRKIESFREARGEDRGGDTIEHLDGDEDEGGCEAILKTTGKKCGRRVMGESLRCGVHTARKAAAAAAVEEGT